jgi:hypothetical protein
MCWITNTIPKLEVAKEDIPVKKILLNYNGSLYSPVFGDGKWKLNVVRATELGEVNYHKLDECFSIRHGFHSCENIHKYDNDFSHVWTNKYFNHLFAIDDGEDVFNAIIPKGSRYYKNEEGDYVSDKLMIIGK